jgi:hypothetical protein
MSSGIGKKIILPAPFQNGRYVGFLQSGEVHNCCWLRSLDMTVCIQRIVFSVKRAVSTGLCLIIVGSSTLVIVSLRKKVIGLNLTIELCILFTDSNTATNGARRSRERPRA